MNYFKFRETQFFQHHDIVVYPYAELLDSPRGLSDSKGGPLWPDWGHAGARRFCRDNVPVDQQPAASPCETTSKSSLAFWCGPVCHHYGHFISDFFTRVAAYLPLETKDSTRAVKFIFADREGGTGYLPLFADQIFKWMGIPRRFIEIVTRPTLFRSLICAPQQEQLIDVPPSKEYLLHLDNLNRRRLSYPMSREQRLYVSRAGMSTGLIAGESYLEYLFSRLGYAVIRPEYLSIREQLLLYSNASHIVFSEGSALHTLQLLGSLKCRVTIILRRSNPFLPRILGSRVASLGYVEQAMPPIHGLRPDSTPCPENGISLVDFPALLDALHVEQSVQSQFSVHDFREAVSRDILKWIKNNLDSPNGALPGARACISLSLVKAGLDPDFYFSKIDLNH